MKRLRRSLIILAASLAATLILIVVRWLNAGGTFTDTPADSAALCTVIAAPEGSGALAFDVQDNILFLAASDRRALDRKTPARSDGLYAYALSNPGAGVKKISGTPADFHPRGISLFRADNGGLTLAVINVPAAGDPAVEVFDVAVKNAAVILKERTAISGGLLVRPESIAAVSPDQFYVTNSGTSTTMLGRFLETYALMPRGNILYFDGNAFRAVADDLVDARGAFAEGQRLYVATGNGRTLYAFERNPFNGTLKLLGQLSIAAGLDKIAADGKGGLLVAATPKPFAEATYLADRARPAPSQIFDVALANGVPTAAEPIFSNNGNEIGAAAAVSAAGNRLFIGSGLDDKVLECTTDSVPENKKGAAQATPF